MSVRERWTVYPLLFLAILLAARDDIFPSEQAKFRSIECQELVVTNVNRENLVHIGETTDQSGIIVVYGNVPSHIAETEPADAANSKKANGPKRKSNTVLVRSPVVELGADTDGGVLRLRSIAGIPTICVGHQAIDNLSGLIAVDRGDELVGPDESSTESVWGSAFSRAAFREKASDDGK